MSCFCPNAPRTSCSWVIGAARNKINVIALYRGVVQVKDLACSRPSVNLIATGLSTIDGDLVTLRTKQGDWKRKKYIRIEVNLVIIPI